jgi:hypothetical protein
MQPMPTGDFLVCVHMYIPPGIHMRHDVAMCILGAEYMRTFDKRS